jgi:hypothetical protein
MIIGYRWIPFVEPRSLKCAVAKNRSMSLSTPPLSHEMSEVEKRVMATLLVLDRHRAVCSLWATACPQSPLG